MIFGESSEIASEKAVLRGSRSITINDSSDGSDIKTNFRKEAQLPNISKIVVSQERFAKELDPYSHRVLFDTNLPSICCKLDDGSYCEIEFKSLAFLCNSVLLTRNLSV